MGASRDELEGDVDLDRKMGELRTRRALALVPDDTMWHTQWE